MENVFLDIKFPTNIVPFYNSSLEFFTIIQTSKNGTETRIILNKNGRMKYEANNILLKRSDFKILKNFFNIVMGQGASFRFQDEHDYMALDEPIEILEQEVQLTKTYNLFSEKYQKIIKKPVASSLKLTHDQNTILQEEIDYSLNGNTGKLSFKPDFLGKKLLASFEFDLEVRFAIDELKFLKEQNGRIILPYISLVEVL